MSTTYVSKALRERVAIRARHRCGYCLTSEEIVGALMEVDHILPESLGGLTIKANLWLACSFCNDFKSNRIVFADPLNGELVSLFNPRLQAWSDHFQWTEAGDYIVGLTPTGRATVVALKLNRPELVRARRLWARAGWHPPKEL